MGQWHTFTCPECNYKKECSIGVDRGFYAEVKPMVCKECSELNNITFVLGFWYHEKNKKHNLEHYLKYIPLTLILLKDCKIVFYYEQDFILDFVKRHIQTKNFKAIKLD